VLGGRLDLMILEVFYNLSFCDSIHAYTILIFCHMLVASVRIKMPTLLFDTVQTFYVLIIQQLTS